MKATTGVDTFDWLDAIERHHTTTDADLLAAYGLLGVEIDRTPEEADESALRLHVAGFLRPVAFDGSEYTYELSIPDAVAA
ncbi:hypothetical protein QM806_36530 [Rhodococcus sp. IEGM 1351]|uniref:hypothetical protein n=1 Tax=Rhodococcus sp. IEGM 1351 TaxID=3047089 RepID=UPI0024B7CF34|nr:hypothetical protein [Rhodococcus sp. IEGM 1351]MDI9940869.1 hypothetical protein [Rhodococcus sp. IEGM 1351]